MATNPQIIKAKPTKIIMLSLPLPINLELVTAGNNNATIPIHKSDTNNAKCSKKYGTLSFLNETKYKKNPPTIIDIAIRIDIILLKINFVFLLIRIKTSREIIAELCTN